MDAAQIGNELTSIVLTTEQIDTRIREIAAEIDKDYASAEKPVLMVGVLKGAVMAVADLSRALQRHVDMDWMAVSIS